MNKQTSENKDVLKTLNEGFDTGSGTELDEELCAHFAEMRRRALKHIPEQRQSWWQHRYSGGIALAGSCAVFAAAVWWVSLGSETEVNPLHMDDLVMITEDLPLDALAEAEPEFFLWLAEEG